MTDNHTYVFVHGGMQGGWVWSETLDALAVQAEAGQRTMLTLDIPGCGGKRGRNTESLTLKQVAAELIEELHAAGARDIVLVGHSQAGTLIPVMLELESKLFSRVVYVSAIAPPRGETVLDYGQSSLKFSAEEMALPDWGKRFCNDMSTEEKREFLGKLGKDAWPSSSYAEKHWGYDHLTVVPASYVICLRDATVPVAAQRDSADRLHASRLVHIDAGHQVMNTRPHALAEALRYEAGAIA